ncbi:MAG: MazG nucleotide pyrophosphohydrolase domain-containing protein [Candidatus ainarchaeum sp.]|nr:MazG nucleotide pyrophosphohydrolase domain-containing protein [Candidatus ainarchaeum sp.]
MKKAASEIKKSLLLARKNCPWEKGQTIEKRLKELKGEVEELAQAIEKNDLENMREEFGDVFWDLMAIGIIAEEKKLFSIKGALEEVNKKIRNRKPWIYGKEKITTIEEAEKRWHELKAIEKAKKGKKQAI